VEAMLIDNLPLFNAGTPYCLAVFYWGAIQLLERAERSMAMAIFIDNTTKKSLLNLVEAGRMKEAVQMVSVVAPEARLNRSIGRQVIADLLNVDNGLGGFNPKAVNTARTGKSLKAWERSLSRA